MKPIIDYAKLDLRGAFDFAIMIEEDAQTRYAELARLLEGDPRGAADVFRAMVVTEGKHASELTARRSALFQDAPRIEISVLDEGPERPDVADDELPTTAREALEVALAAEVRAHAFYRSVAPQVRDPEVRAFFLAMMEEETEHQALLAEKLAALPPEARADRAPQGRPRVEAPAAPPAATYPDQDLLREVLPRFDAATQVVAKALLVDGMREAELAAALGVSRRTIARKLARFLVAARQQLAAAVAAATLAGCASGLPPSEIARCGPTREERPGLVDRERGAIAAADAALASLPSTGAKARAGEAAPRGPRTDGPRSPGQDGELAALAERIHAQVAKRMKRHDPSVHERVAWTVAAEAKRASVDPLLVLALIHVESSFDPHVVSSAGAVGLMQLLEPTMRREMERSGLAPADPRDPVANVQAGVRYLRRLLDAFGGELDTALMAYNAGPNRIRGHLRQGGIPERFHVYPQKVRGELERLRARWTLEAGTAQKPTRSPG